MWRLVQNCGVSHVTHDAQSDAFTVRAEDLLGDNVLHILYSYHQQLLCREHKRTSTVRFQ